MAEEECNSWRWAASPLSSLDYWIARACFFCRHSLHCHTATIMRWQAAFSPSPIKGTLWPLPCAIVWQVALMTNSCAIPGKAKRRGQNRMAHPTKVLDMDEARYRYVKATTQSTKYHLCHWFGALHSWPGCRNKEDLINFVVQCERATKEPSIEQEEHLSTLNASTRSMTVPRLPRAKALFRSNHPKLKKFTHTQGFSLSSANRRLFWFQQEAIAQGTRDNGVHLGLLVSSPISLVIL